MLLGSRRLDWFLVSFTTVDAVVAVLSVFPLAFAGGGPVLGAFPLALDCGSGGGGSFLGRKTSLSSSSTMTGGRFLGTKFDTSSSAAVFGGIPFPLNPSPIGGWLLPEAMPLPEALALAASLVVGVSLAAMAAMDISSSSFSCVAGGGGGSALASLTFPA